MIPALARSAGLDRATAFGLATRIWQLLAAPLTMFVIVTRFTPETQGYYYTFASLLALQSFAELGLGNVVISVASHEWSRLSLGLDGRICGHSDALSRLVSFGRLIFTWYAVASLLFVAVVTVVGYAFFSHADSGTVSWQAPWIILVAITGAQLWTSSFTLVLEGCNQVATVQRFRVIQAMAASVAFWITAGAGGGIWAAVAMAAVRLLTDVYLVAAHYRRFFGVFARPASGALMSWQEEVWPMQWRIGMAGLVNYFAYSLFNPVMFRYYGAVVAGQMGITMQLVAGIQSIAMVFVSTKVPRFGMLIARGDYKELHHLWTRASLVSSIVVAAGGFVLVGLTLALRAMELPLADRLLGPRETAMLAAAALLMQIPQCQVAYMRAHRREMIVVLGVTSSLAIGLLVWLLGRAFGPVGAVGGNLAVAVVVVLWTTVIFRRFRTEVSLAARCA